MINRKHTDAIVVHCADTPSSMDIGVAEIRQWHLDKGWDDIGYHYVIRRNGAVETGRDVDAVGAHVRGFNAITVGICLVGGRDGMFDFTRPQMDSLEGMLMTLTALYPKAAVRGHRDYDNNKSCPGFDVKEWWGE